DDLRPYIYRTHDGGRTWQAIVNGLPQAGPIDAVRADPVRKGLLFAVSENGVWMSFDDGDHWQSLQLNLPHTSVRDIIVHDNDLIVATHGRSFWILDDISPLRQIDESAIHGGFWLSRPAPAIRVRRRTNTHTPLPPDEPAGENPPTGAVIDYYIGRAARTATLEILDSQGTLVRRFSNSDEPEIDIVEMGTLKIPGLWVQPSKTLSRSPGIHRWIWDLRYPAPKSLSRDFPISAVPYNTPRDPRGPQALPGEYTVRLTVDGKSTTAPLQIRMDPRAKTPPGDLRALFESQARLAAMMSKLTDATVEGQSVAKQLQNAALREAADALHQILSSGPASENAPPTLTLGSVARNVSALYRDLGSADVAPTEAQLKAI